MIRFERWSEKEKDYALAHLDTPPPRNSVTCKLEAKRYCHNHSHIPKWKKTSHCVHGMLSQETQPHTLSQDTLLQDTRLLDTGMLSQDAYSHMLSQDTQSQDTDMLLQDTLSQDTDMLSQDTLSQDTDMLSQDTLSQDTEMLSQDTQSQDTDMLSQDTLSQDTDMLSQDMLSQDTLSQDTEMLSQDTQSQDTDMLLQDMQYHCMHKLCRASGTLTRASFSEQVLREYLHVEQLPEKPHLCQKHYYEIYNKLKQPTPCASCGVKPKTGVHFSRHSPNPSLISTLLSQGTEEPISLSTHNTICYRCYKLHLSLLKDNQSSDEMLQHNIQAWLQTYHDEHTNRLTRSILKTVLVLGKSLLHQQAVLLPQMCQVFLEAYGTSHSTESETILERNRNRGSNHG